MDITKIIELVITLIVAPFIPVAVVQFKRWLDAHLSEQQQVAIYEAARLAVLATEQAGLSGAEAKENALALAENALAVRGISVDLDHLSTVIEALVMDEFNRGA